jgi:hypothetical protein
MMKIPYGRSNFADVRRGGYFYADKTHFLPQLESAEAGYAYLLFLRPRRFGKSMLISMFEHYYDLSRSEQFDELFRGLWIHEHPTAERNKYLVLSLDFSSVNTDSPEALRRTFLEVVRSGVEKFMVRYRERFPDLKRVDDRLVTFQDPECLMIALLGLVGALGHKIYLLIDEYDNFVNRLLSDGGQDCYETIVRARGLVRSFYASLKAGTTSGGLSRMFVTGVSPILLEDLSSGFNSITHISHYARFDAMAGFTRAEAARAVDELLSRKPDLIGDRRLGDRADLLDTLEQLYDGYRFSDIASERVFNSDRVLYFLRQIEDTGQYPEQVLGLDVRADYDKLRHLAVLSGAAGGETRDLLETILTEGQLSTRLVEQFGTWTLCSPTEQLASLFFYMGMLTFGEGSAKGIMPQLVIPNRVTRELEWEHLAQALNHQLGSGSTTRGRARRGPSGR